MDMPEKICHCGETDPMRQAECPLKGCGEGRTYTKFEVHRLVKRALEDAAEILTREFNIVDIRVGDVIIHGCDLVSPASCRDAIRSLSPEEIMKNEGL